MTPDDPRHGTYAGYIAHRKTNTPWCAPCRKIGLRKQKEYRLRHDQHGPNIVKLGDRAWTILNQNTLPDLAAITGMHQRRLREIRRKGPDANVYRTTRDKILAAQPQRPVTTIGVARRLQALAKLGWSARKLSEVTGIWPDNLIQVRLGNRLDYLQGRTIRQVVAAYEQLSMTPAPPSRATTWTVRLAERHGWAPPAAWDDIDNPNEHPKGVGAPKGRLPHEVDEAIVLRLLNLERVRSTRAEKEAAMARWVAAGKSMKSLCEAHGWQQNRYKPGDAA